MKKYYTAISDNDLVAHIFSTPYANAVEISSNQRPINIAKTYVSSHNNKISMKQQLRRKEIDKEIFTCKEQYNLEPLCSSTLARSTIRLDTPYSWWTSES
jgi:hypothetical protein